jgi:hypothetical protein
VQAAGLRDCMPLQTLDLSGCALTDASVRCITVIVKVINSREVLTIGWAQCFFGLTLQRSVEFNLSL